VEGVFHASSQIVPFRISSQPTGVDIFLPFLYGLFQKVCFNNKICKILNVTSRVPQGSHLGPLLFGLMINDLTYVTKSSTVLMYADDVKLCLSTCLPFSCNALQLDLYCLLERILSVQDLGVLFDHKLSFKDHISTIANKARRLQAFMKRWSREFVDPYTTKILYVSLVRPSMEYCSCIWSPTRKQN